MLVEVINATCYNKQPSVSVSLHKTSLFLTKTFFAHSALFLSSISGTEGHLRVHGASEGIHGHADGGGRKSKRIKGTVKGPGSGGSDPHFCLNTFGQNVSHGSTYI